MKRKRLQNSNIKSYLLRPRGLSETLSNKISYITFIHTKIQGTALTTYTSNIFLRINFGNRSVGARQVKTITSINKAIFILEGACIKNQIATPVTAITNVGDSALWLNIT